MAKRLESAQLDLFEEAPSERGLTLAPAVRGSALEQLQALLMEATATLADEQEAGDDQDQT
jgi:hypothetical protein